MSNALRVHVQFLVNKVNAGCYRCDGGLLLQAPRRTKLGVRRPLVGDGPARSRLSDYQGRLQSQPFGGYRRSSTTKASYSDHVRRSQRYSPNLLDPSSTHNSYNKADGFLWYYVTTEARIIAFEAATYERRKLCDVRYH